MQVKDVALSNDGSIDDSYIVSKVYEKCEKIQTRGASPTYFVNIPDIGRKAEITRKGISHGFFASIRKNANPSSRDLINAKVSLKIPEILTNSVEVNKSYRKGNDDILYSHIMIGTVGLENTGGSIEYYAVRSVVEERTNQNPILAEAKIFGRLHAINAKKVGSSNLKTTKKSVARGYDETYMYSITDLLNDVKDVFDDTFSEDVYKHFGVQRNNNSFSKNLKYSLPETKSALKTENEKLKADNKNLRELVDLYKYTAGDKIRIQHIISLIIFVIIKLMCDMMAKFFQYI